MKIPFKLTHVKKAAKRNSNIGKDSSFDLIEKKNIKYFYSNEINSEFKEWLKTKKNSHESKSIEEHSYLYQNQHYEKRFVNMNSSKRRFSNDLFTYIRNDLISMKQLLNGILRELLHVTKNLDESEEFEDKELKCKFAAVVLDRLCMVIFSILIFLSTAIIFTAENFLRHSDPDGKF
jgi:hypothetical protein